MMKSTLVNQSLAAAMFLSAQCAAFSQDDEKPEEIVKPRFSQPSVTIKRAGAAGGQAGVLTLEGGDSVLTAPVPPQAVLRGSKPRLISARDDMPPVVVQFSDKHDNTEALNEGLAILTLRIRKAIETNPDEDTLARLDGNVLRIPGNGSVRTIYLDGFGALVFVKAGFPLLAPAASEQKLPAPAADSEWNRAKQELLAEKRKGFAADFNPGQPYDGERVETLKNQILSALKDASNVHAIKPDDFVAVTVFGPPAALSDRNGVPDMHGTVLTIRVKKSDIDAFAADKLDAGKFKEKAVITAYLGNGYGVSSVNSWAKSGSLQLR